LIQKSDKCTQFQTLVTNLTLQLSNVKQLLEDEKCKIQELITKYEYELKEKDKEHEMKQLESQLEETKSVMTKENSDIADQLEETKSIMTMENSAITGQLQEGKDLIKDLKRRIENYMEEINKKDREIYEKDIKLNSMVKFEQK
jgi:predicted  nucleic acid-binding Zn-ribbon protein